MTLIMTRKFLITAMVVLPLFALATIFAGCNQTTDTPAETPTVEAPAPKAALAEPEQAQIDALSRPYLALRESLAQDKFEGAPKQFAAIREAAQALTDSGNPQIQSQAQTLAQNATATPEDIKEARESFKTVSAAAIDLFKAAPPATRLPTTFISPIARWRRPVGFRLQKNWPIPTWGGRCCSAARSRRRSSLIPRSSVPDRPQGPAGDHTTANAPPPTGEAEPSRPARRSFLCETAFALTHDR